MTFIPAHDLEQYLRRFEPLKNVEVNANSLAPWVAVLSGVITIDGEHHAFEADLDLNDFKTVKDLENLVGQILKSFAAATTQVRGK